MMLNPLQFLKRFAFQAASFESLPCPQDLAQISHLQDKYCAYKADLRNSYQPPEFHLTSLYSMAIIKGILLEGNAEYTPLVQEMARIHGANFCEAEFQEAWSAIVQEVHSLNTEAKRP